MKVFKNILIWLFIGVLNALLLWAIILLFTLANYGLGIVISVFLVITDWAIFSSKAYPYRYTLPALFFLFILTIYPFIILLIQHLLIMGLVIYLLEQMQ
jgi:maltose/maltodextrin transport system permease protein